MLSNNSLADSFAPFVHSLAHSLTQSFVRSRILPCTQLQFTRFDFRFSPRFHQFSIFNHPPHTLSLTHSLTLSATERCMEWLLYACIRAFAVLKRIFIHSSLPLLIMLLHSLYTEIVFHFELFFYGSGSIVRIPLNWCIALHQFNLDACDACSLAAVVVIIIVIADSHIVFLPINFGALMNRKMMIFLLRIAYIDIWQLVDDVNQNNNTTSNAFSTTAQIDKCLKLYELNTCPKHRSNCASKYVYVFFSFCFL